MVIGFYAMAVTSTFPIVVIVSLGADLLIHHRFTHYHVVDILDYGVGSLILGTCPFSRSS
jgi:hypothetical protein